MRNGNCCGSRGNSLGFVSRELNQILNEFIPHQEESNLKAEFPAALELAETRDAYEISIDLPGCSPDSVEVEYVEGVLKICGERKDPAKENADRRVHRRERSFGSFCRSIKLSEVDGERITAEFKHGVLQVIAHKIPAVLPRKIEIREAVQ